MEVRKDMERRIYLPDGTPTTTWQTIDLALPLCTLPTGTETTSAKGAAESLRRSLTALRVHADVVEDAVSHWAPMLESVDAPTIRWFWIVNDEFQSERLPLPKPLERIWFFFSPYSCAPSQGVQGHWAHLPPVEGWEIVGGPFVHHPCSKAHLDG